VVGRLGRRPARIVAFRFRIQFGQGKPAPP
jgi:hypothetical protein